MKERNLKVDEDICEMCYFIQLKNPTQLDITT